RLEGLKQAAIEQGKLNVKQQVAKRMKAAGLPLKDIAQYTELSVDEIK
ncbi:MAG: transposase, partial [Moorea sp. SIO2I5]|nr:transposase [Moorena sp. SIO2I5]